jgi:arabinan endo-1,5-alpha-L-arabinosidase
MEQREGAVTQAAALRLVVGVAVVGALLTDVRIASTQDHGRTDRRYYAGKGLTSGDRYPGHRGDPRAGWHWNRGGGGYVVPEFQDVSVHDPSVIRVGDTFYVFGSHLAAAKTTDFVRWEMVADGVNAANPLFDDVVTELAEVFNWTGEVGLWAADVIQLADGRFRMYYNLSRIDSPRAAMGLAIADNVEGPYVAQGVFLRSGMWGQISEDGVNVYDPRIHPNVVDPDVFFDANGKLWMVYGSYSGGIFILEMNPDTGLPLPGQGYGKHLMGGNHSRIEGAYVLYSPDTQYYYLFTSFGGLAADGGYNIRVARSQSPDGPYFDALGNDMANVKSNPSLPLFDDASIAPFAEKLMGNHLFERRLGDPGTGAGYGYVSPGHNSAYYDEDTGRYFLIFHTRFPGRGESHQVRVHEMFMNDAGWPVVAPHRYAPRVREGHGEYGARRSDRVSRHDVPGDYYLVNHGKDISAALTTSRFARLDDKGRIEGEVSGAWEDEGHGRIALIFDEDGSRFEGVASRQWNEALGQFVVTLTATSTGGVSVWGTRLPDQRPQETLDAIAAELSLPGIECGVTGNLSLPTKAARLATIHWTSSHPQYLAEDGTVVRPEAGVGDQTVTLTARITLPRVHGGRRTPYAEKSITVVVRERSLSGLILHYGFEGNLADATTTTTACSGTVSGGFIGQPGGAISFAPGILGQAAVFDGASGVRLRDKLIEGYTYSVALWVNPSALTDFTTTFFGARSPDSWVSVLPRGHFWVGFSTMVWSGTAWYDAGTGMNIPAGAWSHLAFTVDQGNIVAYVNGVPRFTGSGFPDVFTNAAGVFSLGVNWWDLPYKGLMDELRVYEKALGPEEIATLAAGAVP